MSRSFTIGKLKVSIDLEVRSVGIGAHVWIGSVTLSATIDLPFVTIYVTYPR